MSTSTLTTNDFKHTFDNLEPTGKNWVIFQRRFTIAVKAKRVWNHFDGSSPLPTLTAAVAATATAPAIAAVTDADILSSGGL